MLFSFPAIYLIHKLTVLLSLECSSFQYLLMADLTKSKHTYIFTYEDGSCKRGPLEYYAAPYFF